MSKRWKIVMEFDDDKLVDLYPVVPQGMTVLYGAMVSAVRSGMDFLSRIPFPSRPAGPEPQGIVTEIVPEETPEEMVRANGKAG